MADLEKELQDGVSWWIRSELCGNTNWKSLINTAMAYAKKHGEYDPDLMIRDVIDTLAPHSEKGGSERAFTKLRAALIGKIMVRYELDHDAASKIVGGRVKGYYPHEAESDRFVRRYIPKVRSDFGGFIASYLLKIFYNKMREWLKTKGTGTTKSQSYEAILEKANKRTHAPSAPDLAWDEEPEEVVSDIEVGDGTDDVDLPSIMKVLEDKGLTEDNAASVVDHAAQKVLSETLGDKKHIYKKIYDGRKGIHADGTHGAGVPDKQLRAELGLSDDKFRAMREEFYDKVREMVHHEHGDQPFLEKMKRDYDTEVVEKKEKFETHKQEYGVKEGRFETIHKMMESDPEMKREFLAYLEPKEGRRGKPLGARIKKLWGIWARGISDFDAVQKELGELAYPEGTPKKTYQGDLSKQWIGKFTDWHSSKKQNEMEKQANIPYIRILGA